jgi:hypothetical protein
MSAGLAASPFPPAVLLSNLSGVDGFAIRGEANHDYAGKAVCGGGDFNGDGIDDLLLGAPRADVAGYQSEGKAYVIFGGLNIGDTGVVQLSSLDGTNGFTLLGKDRRDSAGSSLHRAGDFNADGIDDFIVGAPGAKTTALATGESYLVLGDSSIGNDGRLDLDALDGHNGFVLFGIDAYDYSGGAVAGLGDVNGDGINDVLIGADEADPNGKEGAGEGYVVFGGPLVGSRGVFYLSMLDGTNGFILEGIDADDDAGVAVAGAGDINNDGFADVLIGAEGADSHGIDRGGQSYVVFGGLAVGADGTIALSALDGSNGFAVHGIGPLDFLGSSVAGIGDVNGDGVDDFAVSADNRDGHYADIGESYVIFGDETVGDGGILDPATLNGTDGFVIRGREVARGERAGYALAGVGDVNGDGFADVAIGAPLAILNAGYYVGKAYVVFGGTDVGVGGVFELSTIDGTNGFAMHGIAERDFAGKAVGPAGDVNGDGIDDLIVGAMDADANGNAGAGEAYVVFGRGLDSDSDGLIDRDDNCTLVSNADQRDTDGDGYGNLCDPDLNGDFIVNFADLGRLKAVFLTANAHADFDGNGIVDFADLGVMKSYFFQPPGPSGLTR